MADITKRLIRELVDAGELVGLNFNVAHLYISPKNQRCYGFREGMKITKELVNNSDGFTKEKLEQLVARDDQNR